MPSESAALARILTALVVSALSINAAFGDCRAFAQSAPAIEDAAPPGFTMERTGGEHDFDYFEGAWTTVQRRLKVRGVGSNDWETFPGNLCMSLHLGGIATVDELYFPTLDRAGLTLRTFDREKRQWS